MRTRRLVLIVAIALTCRVVVAIAGDAGPQALRDQRRVVLPHAVPDGDGATGWPTSTNDQAGAAASVSPAVTSIGTGPSQEDPAQGRGWLVLEGDDLKGMLFIHLGDESGIVLKREPEKNHRKRK